MRALRIIDGSTDTYETMKDSEKNSTSRYSCQNVNGSRFSLKSIHVRNCAENLRVYLLARLCVLSIGHFTVVDGSEAEGDLGLIQTFLLYYVNQFILKLTSIFQEQFP